MNKTFCYRIYGDNKAKDLEENIGARLIQYVEWLLGFIPNVKIKDGIWSKCSSMPKFENQRTISSGSFISYEETDFSDLLNKCGCDIIFSCIPINNKWKMQIFHLDKPEIIEFVTYIKEYIKESNIIVGIDIFEVSPT